MPYAAQPVGVDDDLVLAHHAADRCDFGDIRHRLQFVLQKPVLQRAQLPEVVRARAVDERVFVHPADTGRVRSKRGLCAGGQSSLDLVEVFEHARARPVQVGAILEQHVHERVAEEGIAAYRSGAGHRHHRRRDRIGDLVLDDLRRLPRERSADDDLYVGQVGNRIDRRGPYRPNAGGGEQRARQKHDDAIGNRPANQQGDHGLPSLRGPSAFPMGGVMAVGGSGSSPVSIRLSVDLRLASESIRNWPDTTTFCPTLKPLRISVRSPDSRPTSTSIGRSPPSVPATMTTLRLPVRITASVGTSSASRAFPAPA